MADAVPSAVALRPTEPLRQLVFHGRGSALFGILFVNLLLTVLTLGIYYFWGKVRGRQYILGQAEFEGDRFGYHATGRELLLGWLKVALSLGLLFAIQNGLPLAWREPLAEVVAGLFGGLVFLLVFPLAVVGSRRFRMSRTSWRGIRFSFRGRARRYLRLYLGGVVLSVITLGLYIPFFQNATRKFLIDHTYFGTMRFEYDGRGRDLFHRFVVAAILIALVLIGPAAILIGLGAEESPVIFTPPPVWWQSISFSGGVLIAVVIAVALGLPVAGAIWIWYSAWNHRYIWAHTRAATARFRSTVTFGRLLRLYAGDALRLIPTLGIAFPWVVVRHIRFTMANLFLEGPLDLGAVQQEAQAASAFGESLADALGFFDFDLGL